MKIIEISHENYGTWRNQIEDMLDASARINFSDYNDNYAETKIGELGSYLSDNKAMVFAAVEGNLITGWIWIHEIKRMKKKRLHISEIATREDHRRKGIGQRLLAEAERCARTLGYDEIDLFVTKYNEDAVKFYENAQFEIERYMMKKTVE